MLSVSEKYSQAINADTRRMLHRVTLASNIVLDQTSVPKMTLNESVGGNSGVMLGTSNSASLQLTLRNPTVADYTDILVEPESGIELPDGTIEWIPLGKFYVTDSSTSNDYKTVELTCADGMYLMSGEYISALTYPAPIRSVAREIASQAGVEFVEPTSYPDITIRRKPEKLTLRNAIGYVAGCCGKVARFNRYGQLEFVWYRNTGITVEREQQYLDGFARLNDQPLNVKFNVTGEVERYKVTVNTDDNGNIIATPGTNVLEGETVKLSVVPFYQYALATISAVTANGVPVALWVDADGDEYTFIQPDDDVVINATFALAETVSGAEIITPPVASGGEYSFLRHPSFATPPTNKPYWAIFYKHDTNVGPNAKYYLVWFDSWSLGDSIYLEDKRGYYLNIDGYYYCRGANNGRGQHYWDDATWQGNGASGSTLTWRMGVGRGCDGYGLVASNTSLGDIFTANEEEVGIAQSSWLVNGVDVREKGALSLYACPDTYSTPLPGKYWMLTNRARVYKTDTDGSYTSLYSGSSEVYALFFDGCVITDLGKYYSFHDGNYLKLTFSKLTIAPYLGYDEFYASGAKTINEECYVIISDPDYSSDYESGGGLEYPIGLYATNLSSSYFHNNSPMICDCASSAKFAMRRSAGASVTIDYTNPMITAKMVDGIKAVVEGVAYTPAKVKCRGNPAFEAGDIVTVPDKDGNYHTVLIIQQTMTFGGGMNATITSPGQTEKKSSFSTTGALSSQIRDVVKEESFHQKKDSDAYNSMVVSALNRSMSSMSREVSENGVVIKSLNEWRGATNVALSELTTEVNEHSTTLTSIAKWQSDTAMSVSSIEQSVSANESSITLLNEWKPTAQVQIDALEQSLGSMNGSVADISTQASMHEARLEALTQWRDEAVETLTEIQNIADEHQASIESLAKWKNDTNESLTAIIQTANSQGSSINSLTEWQGTAQDEIDGLKDSLTDTNNTVTSIQQTAGANAAEISTLTGWRGTTNDRLDDLDESVASIQQTTTAHESSITSFTQWQGFAESEIDILGSRINTTLNSLAQTQQKVNDQGAEITSITQWTAEADDRIAWAEGDAWYAADCVAELEQRVDAAEATIELLTKWEGEGADSLAELVSKANANEAAITSLTQWKGATDERIDGLENDVGDAISSAVRAEQVANANEASITSLTEWKGATDERIDGLEGDVSYAIDSAAESMHIANSQGADITLLTEWKGTANNKIDGLENTLNTTNESLAKVTQTANDNKASLETLTKWKTDTAESTASAVQYVDSKKAEITETLTWKNDNAKNIANTIALASEHETKISGLVTWKNGANTRMAQIEAKANEQGTSITAIAALYTNTLDNYTSIDQRVTKAESAIESSVQWQSDVNNSITSIKQTANANSASISSIASWQSGVNSSLASIQQQVGANGASIGMVVQNGSVMGSVLVEAINDQSTAKISADVLDIVGKKLNIKVDAANITGTLEVGRMPSTVAYKNEIPSTTSQLKNDSGYQTESGVVSIIEGTVNADYVKALGISTAALTVTNASNKVMFSADAVARSVQMGGFYVDHNSIYTHSTFTKSGLILCSTGTESAISINGVSQKGWKIVAGKQDATAKYFGVDSNGYMYAESANISGTIQATGKNSLGNTSTCLISPTSRGFECIESGMTPIGVAYASEGIWCKNGSYGTEPIVEIAPAANAGTLHGTWSTDTAIAGSSDRTKKNTIENQSEIYSKIFDRLNPVTFKYNHGKSDRTHLGLIAQDVEDAVLAEGLTTKEFAPVVYDIDEDGNKVNYGIRYEELVSLCIYEIQKLKSRLEKTNG